MERTCSHRIEAASGHKWPLIVGLVFVLVVSAAFWISLALVLRAAL